MKTTLGQNIYALRKQKGLTLQALADKVGTSKSHIWEIENGDIQVGHGLFHRISKVLGKSMNAMMEKQIGNKS